MSSDGILADPEGHHPTDLIEALGELSEEGARKWLRDHPDTRRRLIDWFQDIVESVADLMDLIDEEAIETKRRDAVRTSRSKRDLGIPTFGEKVPYVFEDDERCSWSPIEPGDAVEISEFDSEHSGFFSDGPLEIDGEPVECDDCGSILMGQYAIEFKPSDRVRAYCSDCKEGDDDN